MISIQELKKQSEDRATEKDWRKVREFHTLLADLVESGKAEQLELTRLIPEAKRIVAAAYKKYPASPNFPDSLRDTIKDLHVNVLGAAHDICENRVAALAARLDYIASATPEWFRHVTPKSAADEQGPRRLACLLNGSTVLKKLQSAVDGQAREIDRLLESPVIRALSQAPERAAGSTPVPTTEPKTIDNFDPRAA